MKLEALWASTSDDGFEHVRIDGGSIDGLIVRRENDATYRVRYRLELDSSMRVRSVRLDRLDAAATRLGLNHDGGGRWTGEDGQAIDALTGCLDLDIAASPFTNTLAIWRLALPLGAVEEIRAVYLRPDTFTVETFRQRYSHAGSPDGDDRWVYENLERGSFRAELPVDSNGLCLEYPGFFRRVW